MNTLVENGGDGATPAPRASGGTRDAPGEGSSTPPPSIALPLGALPLGALPLGAPPLGALPLGAPPSGAPPSGARPSGSEQVSGELDCAEPTLFEVVVPADNLTLVELAPQSGQTLILLPEGLSDPASPSPRSRDAASARTVVGSPSPTRGARLLAAVGLARPERVRVWVVPVLVGLLSLSATAIPLWRRAPRSEAAQPPSATFVAPAPHPTGSGQKDTDIGAPSASTVPAAEPTSAPRAQPATATGRRRHPTARISARHNKARAPVMRTRNGAPVVD